MEVTPTSVAHYQKGVTTMAVVTAPLMSAEARGKVSGLVYNTYRGMATVKAKTAPAQPRTALQLKIRALCIQTARAWQLLDPGQRALWDSYAVDHPVINWSGNSMRLTGANWYQQVNVRGRLFQGATYDEPPIVAAPDPVTDFAIADGGGAIDVTWTTTGGEHDWVVLSISGPHSTGQQPRMPKARFTALVAVGTQTKELANLYTGTYDVWIATWNSESGLQSVYQVASVTIA
jgi:hypothetical protein